MIKHLYKHFNPEVHKIEGKIATVRAGHVSQEQVKRYAQKTMFFGT